MGVLSQFTGNQAKDCSKDDPDQRIVQRVFTCFVNRIWNNNIQDQPPNPSISEIKEMIIVTVSLNPASNKDYVIFKGLSKGTKPKIHDFFLYLPRIEISIFEVENQRQKMFLIMRLYGAVKSIRN